MNRVLALSLIFLLGCSRKPAAGPTLNLEKQFEQMMTGVLLVGHSTLDNRDGVSGEERYSIDRVTKLSGYVWMFQARMKLSGHEIPRPTPVPIKWQGTGP